MREGFYQAHDFLMTDLQEYRWSLNVQRIIFIVLLLVGVCVGLGSLKIQELRVNFYLSTTLLLGTSYITLIWLVLYGLAKSVLILLVLVGLGTYLFVNHYEKDIQLIKNYVPPPQASTSSSNSNTNNT